MFWLWVSSAAKQQMYLAKNNFYAKKRLFVLTVAFFTCQATEDKLPRTKQLVTEIASLFSEVWLNNKCHKIYLSGPFGIFCLYVTLTISYLRAQTKETSSLPTDSSRPLFKQIEILSILTVWLYISTVSSFLNIRASYQSASSGFRLLGEIPAGAKNRKITVDSPSIPTTLGKCVPPMVLSPDTI